MSYARFSSSSDVYVYHHVRGGLVCCGCFETDDVDELEQHLQEHDAEGLLVDVDGIMARVRADFPTGFAGDPMKIDEKAVEERCAVLRVTLEDIAKAKGWTLAETVRRCLALMDPPASPPTPAPAAAEIGSAR